MACCPSYAHRCKKNCPACSICSPPPQRTLNGNPIAKIEYIGLVLQWLRELYDVLPLSVEELTQLISQVYDDSANDSELQFYTNLAKAFQNVHMEAAQIQSLDTSTNFVTSPSEKLDIYRQIANSLNELGYAPDAKDLLAKTFDEALSLEDRSQGYKIASQVNIDRTNIARAYGRFSKADQDFYSKAAESYREMANKLYKV